MNPIREPTLRMPQVASLELSTVERAELGRYEAVIKRTLDSFFEAGNALAAIRDGKLYRDLHATFEEYCKERWHFSDRRARMLIDAAEVVSNLESGTTVPVLPTSERQARLLTNLEPEQQRQVWQEAVETAQGGKVTTAHVQAVVDEYREPKDDSDENYTPPYIMASVRSVLGEIDLDPASCMSAQQKAVQATTFYTKDDNGLTKEWHGRVWLNPPYKKPLPFIQKVVEEYESGHVTEAIVLTNNGTETEWGQAMLSRYPVCFVGTRISFWNKEPEQPRNGNRYAQMIFYLGPDPDKFSAEFSRLGVVRIETRNLVALDLLPPHPCPYNYALLPVLARMLKGYERILDPMAGQGEQLLSIRPDAYLNELEPEWAAKSARYTRRSFVGDVCDLQWKDGYFDAIVISPPFGNRMADKIFNTEKYTYTTYTSYLQRMTTPNSSAVLDFGPDYQDFFQRAWPECSRVLKVGGGFILNIKDYLELDEQKRVTDWHIACLQALGFRLVEHFQVKTPGNGYGANGDKRMPYESVIHFVKERA